ncbi:GGDEF domain-containing response regulator [Reinekea thalattae]|uniref:diguanylate cyclase n=1 Tax=Reinekea thalattae TaxID=2593301 RepID=A0A5C8Z918_9GAMM|nr:diguanylate cyclase [Reinekea thalattae]TXR54432.1 diguanylate cyclase [Reinekea thalattae]
MAAVLIVEDSKMVMKVLKHVASREVLEHDVIYAQSRAEANKQLESRSDWLAAIIDLNLPDAPNGELVDDALEKGIPVVVLTGSVDDEKRELLTRKGIVDYVLKEGRYSYQYAVNLINRLTKNQSIKVLVAEDSTATRSYIREVLKRNLFQVVEASDGQEALNAILADDEIRLVLTDYNMPNMDGFELVHELRHKHEKVDLVIIGLSSANESHLSAKFIKSGANDFLFKPFSQEEFACRIFQAVESMERLEEMRRAAYTDLLTGVGNRRHLIEKARTAFAQAYESGNPLALAAIDIDQFKHINDDYGHDAGDAILVAFAAQLQQSFGRFIVARTGGQEFCILFSGLSSEQAAKMVDLVRQQVENEFYQTSVGEVSMTFSAGIAQLPAENLEALMSDADQQLQAAKEAGRNQVSFT